MTVTEYIKDKVLMIVLHICCMFVLLGFLHATGYPWDYCILVLACWGLIVTVVFSVDFYQKKKYFTEMAQILENIDQRYLLGELMPDSPRLTDRLYREMIRFSNKSVIERIRSIEEEKREYQEFIESWVHEIKAPITGVSLMCENHKDELAKRILPENRKIENYVDMALYYARSGEVYKDYMIHKTDLSEIVFSVLAKNKYYLIQNHVQVETDCGESVYTDEKWISFILNQLILNSVKYKKGEKETLWIYTETYGHGVYLIVKDDGIGIKKEELPRIFDKGFTGSNGRKVARSTGMGLYLCQNLCEKLGIKITAYSKENEGTKMVLEFPVGNYHAREDTLS